MDTSPHIGGAADSQKDRGVRQRKSLVFLFVIPDSSDMQQNESVVRSRHVRGPNSGEVRPSYMYASFVLDAYVSQNIGDTCVFQNKTRLKYLTHARVSK